MTSPSRGRPFTHNAPPADFRIADDVEKIGTWDGLDTSANNNYNAVVMDANRLLGLHELAVEELDQDVALARVERVLPQLDDGV